MVLVHYLPTHTIGGHFGTTDDERRETMHFQLHAVGPPRASAYSRDGACWQTSHPGP